MAKLYRRFELAYATQYAEVKERALAAGVLLPGTPGRLKSKVIGDTEQIYRDYYATPAKRVETWVAAGAQAEAIEAMQTRIEASQWFTTQVATLRRLGYQVGDRGVGEVLVGLANAGLFAAGLQLVGSLAVMYWLNELGVYATAQRTRDVDIARRRRLQLAGPVSFLDTMRSTGLPFAPIPEMPAHRAPTSIGLPGKEGLRVGLLAPASHLGASVPTPELSWNARGIPHYAYLLERPQPAAALAGGHCVLVRMADPYRLVWHKLYSSTQRGSRIDKAEKDRVQAATLGAALAEEDQQALRLAFTDSPAVMRRQVHSVLDRTAAAAADHPEFVEVLEDCG